MKTEFPFILPQGYIASDGVVQSEGSMRLALARDEIEAFGDPLVQRNEAYLSIVLLSRVITRLGSMNHLTTEDLANFFAVDLAYLEDLYLRINSTAEIYLGAICPHCGNPLQIKAAPLRETEADQEAAND